MHFPVIYNYKNKALQDVLPQFLDAEIPTIDTEVPLKRWHVPAKLQGLTY
jgi:hypothetical protein